MIETLRLPGLEISAGNKRMRWAALLLPFLSLLGAARIAWADPYGPARERMVRERIEQAGVRHERVLEAMRTTPRHEFVPRPLRAQAYVDMSLPIGEGQTISSPFTVALMTEALDPQPTDRVLEIGTGSGYQAAVLSPLVEEVFTIEIVEPLGRRAAQTLEELGYENVRVRVGDGFKGWPEEAPFDKIIVTCSPESVPQPLVEQLRDGGRLVIPVGERYQQTLYLMVKRDGVLEEQAIQPTLFVPMTGTAEAQRSVQPDPQRPELVNGNFETPPESDEEVPGWYYGRQFSLESEGAQEGEAFVRFRNDLAGRDAHLLQGLPLDGRSISRLRLEALVRTEGVVSGGRPEMLPMLAITLFDAQRRQLATYWIGPFRGSRPWRRESRTVRVPPQTREAIVRIGLFGATGQADFDAVAITPIP